MYVHLSRLVWLALALAGCDKKEEEGSPSDSVPDLSPEIELGTGETAFEPLADGDTIYIVYGPQGGYHFTVSMNVQGINAGDPNNLDDPSNPVTSFRAYRDGEIIDLDASTYQQGIDPIIGEPGRYQMLGRRLILNYFPDTVEDLYDDEVEVTVEVTDADGVSLTDTRTLIAVPHPLND